jgi:hypothetical protein
MISLDLPAFYLGVKEELEKLSFDTSSMPVNENILPNITNQAKWKYVRTKDGLKLSDGNLVYSFGGFPDDYPAEDLPVSRLSDDNILNFEQGALNKGTAQIHRASPDNIYLTLATGADNPTFMLQHEQGQNWRYSPSKKFMQKLKMMQAKTQPQEAPPISEQQTVSSAPEIITSDSVLIDPNALIQGAKDEVKTAAYNPYTGTGHGMDANDLARHLKEVMEGSQDLAGNAVDFASENPASTMAIGYFGSKGISNLLDAINPSREEERARRSIAQRLGDELTPLGISALPVLAAKAIKAE